jgi:flagellar hook assembly protein FlgD
MAISPLGATSGGPSGTQASKKNAQLKTEDFIKMMITQLQHQDPLEPAKNQELLAQMSQIGQLQSATSLQESLKGMAMQNQIGSASALIGKTVQGLDGQDDRRRGLRGGRGLGRDHFLGWRLRGELLTGRRVHFDFTHQHGQLE